jgi:hypothetical protein
MTKRTKVSSTHFPKEVLQTLADYIRESKAKSETGKADRADVIKRFNAAYRGRGYRLTIGRLAALYRPFGKKKGGKRASGLQADFLKAYPPRKQQQAPAKEEASSAPVCGAAIERPPKPAAQERTAASSAAILPEAPAQPAPEPVPAPPAEREPEPVPEPATELRGELYIPQAPSVPHQRVRREVAEGFTNVYRLTAGDLGPEHDAVIALALVEWMHRLQDGYWPDAMAFAAMRVNTDGDVRYGVANRNTVQDRIGEHTGIKRYLLKVPAFTRRYADHERLADAIMSRVKPFEDMKIRAA